MTICPLELHSRHRSTPRLVICALLAFLLPLLLYLPTLRFSYLNLDDTIFVTGNRIVLGGLSLDNLRAAFLPRSPAPMYIPLLWISYMLDVSAFGAHPWAFHFTNALLHAVNTLLLFFLLLRLERFLPSGTMPSAPRPAFLPPLFLALLWALHPLRVESVAWIAERKDGLAVFFCLLTLLSWLPAVAPGTRPRHRVAFGALAFFCFLLGLLSKPSLVPLPLLLALLAFPPFLPRPRILPLALAMAPFCVLALLSAWATASVHTVISNAPAPSILARVATVPSVVFFYLGKTLCPVHLAVIYPRWTSSLTSGLLLAIPLVLAALWIFARRRACPLLWLGSALGILFFLPVLGIVHIPFNLVADRYTCLPSIGLSIALLGFFPANRPPTDAPRRGKNGMDSSPHATPRKPWCMLHGAFCVVLAALAAATAAYLPAWSDTASVFRPVRRLSPDHPNVRSFDAISSMQRGDFAASHAFVKRYYASNPQGDYALALIDAVNVNALHGAQAALDYLMGLPPPPASLDYPQWDELLGMFQLVLGHDAEALSTALRTLPHTPKASAMHTHFLEIAMIASHRLGHLDDALSYARLAGRAGPDATELSAMNFLSFYLTLWNSGLHAPALGFFRQLAASRPDPAVLNNIAWILASSFYSPAPLSEPVALARQALDAVPTGSPIRPTLLDTLSVALANASDFPAAIAAVSEAIALLPPSSPSLPAMQRRLALYRQSLPYREFQAQPVPPEEYDYTPRL